MTPILAAVGPDHTIDLAAPDFSHIPWRVLIESLCVLPRFNGAFGAEPTIGGHSLHVTDMVNEELKLAALLHDFTEAAMGDVIRPTRTVVDQAWRTNIDTYADDSPIIALEHRLQVPLFAKAGLVWPLEPDAMVRLLDADDAVGQHELQLGKNRRLHILPNDHRNPSPDQLERALRMLLDKHGVPYGVEV
ncbi:MAG: hypothetical protein AAF234_16135 [Pseudomonadota bacterium]